MDKKSQETSWGKFSDAAEADLSEYRVLSGLAVVGLILGLLSALAIVHVTLSFVGAAAILCCVVALVRISASPSEMSGRWLAVTGLTLAVFLTAAGIAREAITQRLHDINSRAIAAHWFEFLKTDEPEKACELGSSITIRRPLDDELMGKYLKSRDEYEGLQTFVSRPGVRALLDLGDRAQVRHYKFDGADAKYTRQIYAVTYEEDGVKKSFLLQISLIHETFPDRGFSSWRISGTTAPWTPES